MNKKQLIILWITGILICSVFLFTPPKYIAYYPAGGISSTFNNVQEYQQSYGNSAKHPIAALRWETIIPNIVVILIIGSLLVYTLRKDILIKYPKIRIGLIKEVIKF